MANTVDIVDAQKWAIRFLKFLGSPATSTTDPRVAFLAAQYMHEGDGGTNPLAITNAEGQPATNLPGNSAGVKVFTSTQAGMKATKDYLINQGITGYLGELHNPNATLQSLTSALASAGWEGHNNPAAQAASQQYANSIGQAAGLNPTSMNPTTVGATPNDVTTKQPPASANQQVYINPLNGDVSTIASPAMNASYGGGNFTPQIQRDLLQNFAGPDSYKGFDMSGIPPTVNGQPNPLYEQAKHGIDLALATPGGVSGMMNDIAGSFGSEGWMAAIPALRTLIVAATFNAWPPDVFQAAIENTNWWKNNSDLARTYQMNLANDPGQIYGPKGVLAQTSARVTDIANSMGVQLTPSQLSLISSAAAHNSITSTGMYSNTAESDQQIKQMVAQDFNATSYEQSIAGSPIHQQIPQQPSWTGTPNVPGAEGYAPPSLTPAGPVTAQLGGGDASELINKFTNIATDYYLNMSPNQIANEVQKRIRNYTGQGNFVAGAEAAFTQYAQQQARMLFPAFASAIGSTTSTANDQNMYSATAGYRSLIAEFTGNKNPDTINLRSPQWSWILTGSQPPNGKANIPTAPGNSYQGTPGQPPSIDTVQKYLMSTPQFQTTTMAKQMAWQVGSEITKAFGYN